MRSEPSCDIGGCLFLGMVNRCKLVKLRLIGYGFLVFSIRRILSAPDFNGYEIYYLCRPGYQSCPFLVPLLVLVYSYMKLVEQRDGVKYHIDSL